MSEAAEGCCALGEGLLGSDVGHVWCVSEFLSRPYGCVPLSVRNPLLQGQGQCWWLPGVHTGAGGGRAQGSINAAQGAAAGSKGHRKQRRWGWSAVVFLVDEVRSKVVGCADSSLRHACRLVARKCALTDVGPGWRRFSPSVLARVSALHCLLVQLTMCPLKAACSQRATEKHWRNRKTLEGLKHKLRARIASLPWPGPSLISLIYISPTSCSLSQERVQFNLILPSSLNKLSTSLISLFNT